jgi:hypothetical protein
MRLTRNQVCRKVPGVRIPPSPPCQQRWRGGFPQRGKAAAKRMRGGDMGKPALCDGLGRSPERSEPIPPAIHGEMAASTTTSDRRRSMSSAFPISEMGKLNYGGAMTNFTMNTLRRPKRRESQASAESFSARRTPPRFRRGTSVTWESMSRSGEAPRSRGPMHRASRPGGRPRGPSAPRMANTSRPARRPSWSTIGSRT